MTSSRTPAAAPPAAGLSPALTTLFAVACVLPAQARATLVFQRGVVKPVIWTAHDDGSAQRGQIDACGRVHFGSPSDGGRLVRGGFDVP